MKVRTRVRMARGGALAAVGVLVASVCVTPAHADDCELSGTFTQASLYAYGLGTFFSGCPVGSTELPRLALPQDWSSAAFEWSVNGDGPGKSMMCSNSMVLNDIEVLDGRAQQVNVMQFAPPGQMVYSSWRAQQDRRPVTDPLQQALSTPTRSGSARFTIDCGADGRATWSRPFDVLPAPPVDRDPGVSIDDGADFTNSSKVRLYLGWDSGQLFDRVKVSNDGGFAPSKSRTFDLISSEPIDWKLVDLGNERLPKTVYLKFGVAGSSSWYPMTYTDDIILDTVKPQVLSVSLARSGAASLVGPRMVRVKAKDNKSGLASIQVSAGKPRTKAKIQKFRKTVPAPKSGRVFVRVRDGAGNWSSWRAAG